MNLYWSVTFILKGIQHSGMFAFNPLLLLFPQLFFLSSVEVICMSKQALRKQDESYCRLSPNSGSLKFNQPCLIGNECTQNMGSSDHCSPVCTLKFAGKVFKGISFWHPKSEGALKSFYRTVFSSFFLQPVTQKNELRPLVITCNSITLNALQSFLPIGFITH